MYPLASSPVLHLASPTTSINTALNAENLTKISLNDAALHLEMDLLIFAKCIVKLFKTNDQFICSLKSLLFITVCKCSIEISQNLIIQ